jgi:dolichyl-diphosphooligosaccharide--protein glycosyltransferase
VIDAPTTRALLDIKKLVPKYSAMFTPYWEFGYPFMEIGEFATYHDGGLQGGMRSTLASIATMSPRQNDMVSMLSYVEDHGFKQLASTLSKEKLSADSMLKLVYDYPGEFSGENVYVIYLEEMIWKIFSLSRLGMWDFEKKDSNLTDYVEIHCFSTVDNVMRCRDGTIDLNRGLMNDGSIDMPLRAALVVNDGYVVNQRDYEHKRGHYLQVLMKKGKVYMILVADGPLFHSNFNQQYLLGNYDKRYFEEVYNDFPVARLFKVKNKARKNPAETQ